MLFEICFILPGAALNTFPFKEFIHLKLEGNLPDGQPLAAALKELFKETNLQTFRDKSNLCQYSSLVLFSYCWLLDVGGLWIADAGGTRHEARSLAHTTMATLTHTSSLLIYGAA